MDGLAGNPAITFAELSQVLARAGHSVELVSIRDIDIHEDRIWAVKCSYQKARRSRPSESIVLLGYSAGGSAARILTERLSDTSITPPDGLIMLSPAMPRWIWYSTTTLAWMMLRRIMDILFARRIRLSDAELLKLLGPVPRDMLPKILGKQIPIAGGEARKLIFPDPLGVVNCPVLHIWGDQDRWIRPKAQHSLCRKMRERGTAVTSHVLNNCGHGILHSDARNELHRYILTWLKTIS
jgi:pimeloyl-ACP methyl ester carboxylesterase